MNDIVTTTVEGGRIFFPVPTGATCAYCPAPATSWDHVRPIAWGGEDEPHNMVPACWPCNKAKRGQPAEVFRLSRPEREQWLRERGWTWAQRAWWSPITGKPHIFRFALRKAAWGDDAEPVQRHDRRRYW
jgi:hypothetical protein